MDVATSRFNKYLDTQDLGALDDRDAWNLQSTPTAVIQWVGEALVRITQPFARGVDETLPIFISFLGQCGGIRDALHGRGIGIFHRAGQFGFICGSR